MQRHLCHGWTRLTVADIVGAVCGEHVNRGYHEAMRIVELPVGRRICWEINRNTIATIGQCDMVAICSKHPMAECTRRWWTDH